MNAFANGDPRVRVRSEDQSICWRSARVIATQPRVVERVLVERPQHRHEHVLERHHRRRDRHDRNRVGACDHIVGEIHAGGAEDHVDHHVAVPGLVEPLLRRMPGSQAGAGECVERGVCVRGRDH
jgi:hypothetical protein